MDIVVVGGGTAGWVTAMMAAKHHPNHKITVIESSKIGVVGVVESTTGRMTDILINFTQEFGCDHNEFIVETGATLKYAIHHKGWTPDISKGYMGPIDGSATRDSVPDPLFSWGLNSLAYDKLLTTSECGYWIDKGLSNFDAETGNFINYRHAMHVDAHKVGQYFKKIALRNNENVRWIDSEVTSVLHWPENGNIRCVGLSNGGVISGDFWIDCSGFNKVLMNSLNTKWISYQDNLPLNTGLPFWLDYEEGEVPEPYTTAWAQKNGWMWQIPLMDRKGCGYVFCDAYTTPEKAQEEIETLLGRKINPQRVLKFDAGRQESAWVKNCLAVGLSSAFLEPLEATSIHSTIVQAHNFVSEFLKHTLDDTLNEGSMKIYNQRTRMLYDDVRDFIVMHYQGGRTDSEFWKYISSGATRTDFVSTLLETCKSRVPSTNDFPKYPGVAGWPLYSFVLAGLNLIDKGAAKKELDIFLPKIGPLSHAALEAYYDYQDIWKSDTAGCLSYKDFIKHFRDIRYQHGFSDKKY